MEVFGVWEKGAGLVQILYTVGDAIEDVTGRSETAVVMGEMWKTLKPASSERRWALKLTACQSIVDVLRYYYNDMPCGESGYTRLYML